MENVHYALLYKIALAVLDTQTRVPHLVVHNVCRMYTTWTLNIDVVPVLNDSSSVVVLDVTRKVMSVRCV